MSVRRFYSIHHRAGAILMVVVAFLGLGLSLGLTFVFYAQQQATSMRYQREAAQGGRSSHVSQVSRGYSDEAPPQAYDIANRALSQLIYDVPDNDSGIESALRGASLARTMYGLYYGGSPNTPTYSNNDVPYCGIGRYRTADGSLAPPLLASINDGNYRAVNYTYFQKDGFLRDPERIGHRTNPNSATWNVGGTSTAGNYFPLNAPYTYPDEKDIYLAAIRAADGRVLAPSFYRPSTFGSLAPSNPNWTNAVGKYLIHRPRPIDMGTGFPAVPANADGSYTGDIEQLEGKAVHENDSMWLDLDLPVRQWRGRDYKPLVAFLITDLDGRINVNTAGNCRGFNSRHASNQGWGEWEVDLQRIFHFHESSQLFLDPRGRYGPSYTPNMVLSPTGSSSNEGNAIPVGVPAPFYSIVDFDGSLVTNSGPQVSMQLPQAGTGNTSPSYSPRSAGSSLNERKNHPALCNPFLLSSMRRFTPPSGNRSFNSSEMYYLNLKYNGDNARYQQSELGQLMPKNLGQSCTPGSNGWPAAAVNPRYLMTTISNDLDRAGLTPWILNQPTNYTMPQPLPINGVYATSPQPTAASVPYPSASQRIASINAQGTVNDFSALTWKANKAGLGTVDLNRSLADYRVDPTQPYEAPGNVTPTSAALAIADRQRLAKDIFDRFCAATGTQKINVQPKSDAFNALRYLAQLAVNMVDFIDADDYITPFAWNPIDPADPTNVANFSQQELPNRVVFGTELPRFVINEAYIRVENGSAIPGQPDYDPGLTSIPPQPNFYVVKVWSELINPLVPPGLQQNPPGPAAPSGPVYAELSHNGGAPLAFNGQQVYRLLLTAPNANLWCANNVKGDPDPDATRSTVNLPAGCYNTVGGVVPYSNGSYIQGPAAATSSFYVVGPENRLLYQIFPSALSDEMKYHLTPQDYQNQSGAPTDLLLQRLACPHLPFGPTNPFITVDVMRFTSNMIDDSILGILIGTSWGRKQPYAGHPSQVVAQASLPIGGLSHTFFRHNGQGNNAFALFDLTLTQPFDWLVHLDRPLISPIEALNVSAYKPHELTRQFVIGNSTDSQSLQLVQTSSTDMKFQHLADWTNDSTRLHRAFSFLQTRNLLLGLGAGGRVPGLVNVNTIWDEPIFDAVCDADGANKFNPADVQTIWSKLFVSRTPSGTPSAVLNQDRPFWSAGAPIDSNASAQFPAGVGVNNTLYRADPAQSTARLFDVPGQSHPYLRTELMNKIQGRLTTRSNCFAVWMTIGYFEVTDRNARPVKLGKELGSDDGTSVRQRFFAVIDRTNLATDPNTPSRQGPTPVFFSYEPALSNGADPVTPGTVSAMIPAVSLSGGILRGIYDDTAWCLQCNDYLIMDVGRNQEKVPVQIMSFTPGIGATISITCSLPHSRGCPLMIANTRLGNPGPQPGFNVRDPRYSAVVRFFASLD